MVRLQAGKSYDLKIEYYENSGWSYASLVWQLRSGVDPRIQAAAELARKSDVAIVAVGIAASLVPTWRARSSPGCYAT